MLEEHRRIFSFWPPSGPVARCPSRASQGARPYFIPKNTFTRTFVCQVYSEKDVIPDASERIRLSMAGLGEAKIVFNKDRNALHVHEKIIESFSALAEGGGYEMLRKLEGSTKWLMQIPHPPKGFTLNRPKLSSDQPRGNLVLDVQKDTMISISPVKQYSVMSWCQFQKG